MDVKSDANRQHRRHAGRCRVLRRLCYRSQVAIAVALAVLSTVTSGCFRYVPTVDPVPRIPVDVRLRVTPADGEATAADQRGFVSGRLLAWTEEAVTLVWRSGPGLSDLTAVSSRQAVIGRDRVLSVEVREMDRRKTAWVLAGAAIIGTVSWFGLFEGGAAGGSPRPSPPGDVTIIPPR